MKNILSLIIVVLLGSVRRRFGETVLLKAAWA